ncbi:hypothetical protein QUA03_26475, partial [Microcoleus sp. S36b_A4]
VAHVSGSKKLYDVILPRTVTILEMSKASRIQAPGFIPKADSGPRNKKLVSDETCPPNLSVGSMLQFFNL